MEIIFWLLVFLVFYTYLGYGLIVRVLLFFRGKRQPLPAVRPEQAPRLTLVIAAYNEREHVDLKMANCLALDYPADKLEILWVTDGSDDGTPELLARHPRARVLHQPERQGKSAALNRAMRHVSSPIVAFTDANTMLGANALAEVAGQFGDPGVGCVAGRKSILRPGKSAAASSGEEVYWSYEASMKRLDAQLYSNVGAPGELFALRTELFEELEEDTLLDDLMLTLRAAMRGYRIQYAHRAVATETASADMREEMKRKVRIAAGSFQAMSRLWPLLNPFRHGWLSWQFFSRKFMRWFVVPPSLLLLFPLNLALALPPLRYQTAIGAYDLLLAGQSLFYLAALLGGLAQDRPTRGRLFFVPYYLFMMNWAVFLGARRHWAGQQSVNWERARRGSR